MNRVKVASALPDDFRLAISVQLKPGRMSPIKRRLPEEAAKYVGDCIPRVLRTSMEPFRGNSVPFFR
jgi:hypothetical protein